MSLIQYNHSSIIKTQVAVTVIKTVYLVQLKCYLLVSKIRLAIFFQLQF